jgi:hypothetical protein
MIASLRLRPFADPGRRAWRLAGASAVLLLFAGLALWNPAERPGPVLCPLRLAVALPCPLCGVTRGVALCLRGRALEAAGLNPLAPLVFLGLLVLGCKWAAEYLVDRRLVLVWGSGWRRGLLLLLHAALLLAWAFVLLYRREDDFAHSGLGRLLGWLAAGRGVE